METFLTSFIATFAILTLFLAIFDNEEDDDDDHGGGMMVPIYVPSNS